MSSLWITVALAAVFGLAGVAAWRFAYPPPTPLSVALARLQRHHLIDESAVGWKPTLGKRVASPLENFGVDLERLRADLRITGGTVDAHVGSKVVCAALPLLFTGAIVVLLQVADVDAPLGLFAAVSVVGMAVGFVAPDLTLRSNAQARRREFSLAFGSYLDLVAISLAGGMGTEAALVEAARIGDSWVFTLLRRAIDTAQIEGSTVWASLSRLGDDLRVPVLGELAASVALAGNEGAKVRSSIAVKADTLRAVELADAEAHAQAATERMAVPTALLLFGFVILIGFPAVIAVAGI